MQQKLQSRTRSTMSSIEFSEKEKELLVRKLKIYFNDELDFEIGQFDAEFFLDFITKEIGGYHYNKGLKDAQEVFKSKVDSIIDTIYELEIPTEFSGK